MNPLQHTLFIKFMAYFNENQDYFECHEVLEDYWNIVAPRDKQHPLIGYIQIAVGLYHWRRGNFRGAAKTFVKGERLLLDAYRNHSTFMDGIDGHRLLRSVSSARTAIEGGRPFVAFRIRITDTFISDAVDNLMERGGVPEIKGARLIHKHMLRDRSHILIEREKRRSSRH